MGTLYSTIQRPIGVAAESVSEIIRRRKRKRDDDEENAYDKMSSALELSMNTPKKKKLLTTAQYIYQALYKEEKNSDVSVMALGKIWRLHKVYLSQSPYFASMFCGSWKESNQDFIKIEIIDNKITVESLSIVFGSLYLDEVDIEPTGVVSILATVALFQLDGLLDRCCEVMIETTNAETAVSYYDAACQYGIPTVKDATYNWLLVNLMSLYSKNSKWLRTIGVELMHALVSSSDLYVMPTEFSLYIFLKFWLFLKLHPNYDYVDTAEAKAEPLLYFKKREGNLTFLDTYEGQQYEKVFRALRLEHIITDLDFVMLFEDKILPRHWIQRPICNQWSKMLKIDSSQDKGPSECDETIFYKNCLRCGRMLNEESFQKWRWNGFNFGLSLVLIMDSKVLSIKRYHRSEDERLLSLQVKRTFLIRVNIASLNELRQVKHSQTTGIKSITLEKNSEEKLLILDKELIYPLLISVNLLVVTPNQEEIEIIDTISSTLDDDDDNLNNNNFPNRTSNSDNRNNNNNSENLLLEINNPPSSANINYPFNFNNNSNNYSCSRYNSNINNITSNDN